MLLKNSLITFSILFLLTNFLYSQKNSVTIDGKKTLSKENKTWEYIKEGNQKKKSSNFRGTVWGMSKQKVKSIEKLKIIKDTGNILIYKGKVANLNTYIVYIFVNNKLVRTKYIIRELHTNKNDYIFDYKKIKRILTKKYGPPKSDKQIWLNNLYKTDTEDWGLAISIGHLKYYSEWETDDSIILLALFGDNYKITLGVEYVSKELRNLEKKVNEEKTLNEF